MDRRSFLASLAALVAGPWVAKIAAPKSVVGPTVFGPMRVWRVPGQTRNLTEQMIRDAAERVMASRPSTYDGRELPHPGWPRP